MKKHKIKIIVALAVVAVLVFAYWYGGNGVGARGWQAEGDRAAINAEDTSTADGDALPQPQDADPALPETDGLAPEESGEQAEQTEPAKEQDAPGKKETPAEQTTMTINPETGKDQYQTDPVPEGKPLPVEPENVTIGSTAYSCTLSISCVTILDNMDWLDKEKWELVPEDGWILKATKVTFYEGESVFNVLQRTCKQQKIHMEFVNTPIYNSAYIEGIHNLYEFDVGELSGWMYRVNGWFPNYGCSRYQLQDGDTVEWVYTCDLGYDVGGGYAVGN